MSMGDSLDVTQYILASKPEEQSTITRAAASNLKSKTLKLRTIIEALRGPLFSEDAVQRAKAVQFLSDILLHLDGSTLPRQDVTLLVQFLVKRFESDPAGLKESAQALQILQAMRTFDAVESSAIPESIFLNVEKEFPSQNASTRLEVYKLLDGLLSSHRDQMRHMGGNFIDGLLALCVNEGDPRNLMICFSIIHVILSEWDADIIKDHKDALWESTSRYFPITFRPKPNEPINITADDLKLRLRSCFAATSLFAGQAFPFLLQKLDDQTTANVKKDIMRTISACASSYDPSTVSIWSSQLWDALKYEVRGATEDELAAEASETLQAIATRLSFGLTLQTLEDTPLFGYIEAAVMECSRDLVEKGSRFSKQSGQILESLAAASPFAFHLIVRSVMPLLIAAYEKNDSTIAEKRTILETVNRLFDAKFQIIRNQEKSEFPAISIIDGISDEFPEDAVQGGGLNNYKESLGSVFASALASSPAQEVSYRLAAVQGLLKLVLLPNYLTNDEAGLCIGIFNQIVLDNDSTDKQIRNQAIAALQQAAPLYPREILDRTFPALLGTLPDVLQNDEEGRKHLAILGILGMISSQHEIFDTFVRRLLNKLDVVIRSNSSQRYAHIILIGLLFAIEQREDLGSLPKASPANSFRDSFQQYQTLVKALYQKVVTVSVNEERLPDHSKYVGLRELQTAGGPVHADHKFLELVGKIAMTAVRSMSLEQQEWAAAEVFTLFAGSADEAEKAILQEGQLQLDDASADQKSTLILSMYLLAGLRREVHLNFHPQEVCTKVLYCFDKSREIEWPIHFSLLSLVAILANKWGASAINGDVMLPQDAIRNLANAVGLRAEEEAKNIVLLVSTYTMAANFRGDRSTNELLQLLLSGLDDQHLGQHWAKGFQVLLTPSDVLYKENFAVIRPLYKQRLFATCVPVIVERFKGSADKTVKVNYLVALSGILKWIPSDIIMPEIETLLPLLLQSLETPSNTVKAASIDVLLIAIKESPAAVESHVQGIIMRLISSFQNKTAKDSACTPAVRAKALVCMAAIPAHLRVPVLLPYKRIVLQRLGHAVDDPKRKVRTEAVDCQMVWWNLAEPTDDD